MEQIKTQIPRCQLEIGRWYVGRGRNANVAQWDGKHFLTIAEKCGSMVVKKEGYYEAEYGCFQPFLLIDEGENPDFDKNFDDLKKYINRYGTKLIFDFK